MSLLQEAEAIIQKIKQQQYADLLAHDQLLMERKEQKVFLHFGENRHPSLAGRLPPAFCLPFSQVSSPGEGLCLEKRETWPDVKHGKSKLKPWFCLVAEEEEITFAPTYRFERLTRDKYAYTKQKATGVSPLPCPPSPPPSTPHPAHKGEWEVKSTLIH